MQIKLIICVYLTDNSADVQAGSHPAAKSGWVAVNVRGIYSSSAVVSSQLGPGSTFPRRD